MEHVLSALLVEPDSLYRDALKKVLERENVTVLETTSLGGALDILARSSVELIITEIVLGGSSGSTVIETLLEASPDSLIIVLTVYTELIPEDVTEHLDSVMFMKKPVGLKQIIQAVSSQLHERVRADEDKMSNENPA